MINSKVLYGAIVLGVIAAACGGGGSTGPTAGAMPVVQTGAVTLGTSQTITAFPPSGSYSGTVTYPSGTGAVTVGTSAAPPSGVNPLVGSGDTPLIYLAYSGTAAINGIPGVSIQLPGAAMASSYYEAIYNGASWNTVTGATVVGTVLQAGTTNTPQNLASGPVYVVVYSGPAVGEPVKSPPICVSGNAVCDPGFESGTAVTYPASTIATTGEWTQCTINPTSTGLAQPASSYTPTPNSTPGAVIASFIDIGSAPQGSATPAPPARTVTTRTGNFAAELGGVFSNYNMSNFAYNGLCQTVTVPSGGQLVMYILGSGDEASAYVDFDVNLLDSTGKNIVNLYTENTETDTQYRRIAMDLSAYSGQTVNLFIGLWTKSGSSSGSTKYAGYYFVDDVYLGTDPPTATSGGRRR